MPLQQLLIDAGNVAGPVAFTTFFVERTVFLCLHLLSCSPFFLSSPSLSPLLSSPLLCSPLLSLSVSLSLSLSVSGVRAVFAVTDGGEQNDVVPR